MDSYLFAYLHQFDRCLKSKVKAEIEVLFTYSLTGDTLQRTDVVDYREASFLLMESAAVSRESCRERRRPPALKVIQNDE